VPNARLAAATIRWPRTGVQRSSYRAQSPMCCRTDDPKTGEIKARRNFASRRRHTEPQAGRDRDGNIWFTIREATTWVDRDRASDQKTGRGRDYSEIQDDDPGRPRIPSHNVTMPITTDPVVHGAEGQTS